MVVLSHKFLDLMTWHCFLFELPSSFNSPLSDPLLPCQQLSHYGLALPSKILSVAFVFYFFFVLESFEILFTFICVITKSLLRIDAAGRLSLLTFRFIQLFDFNSTI